MGLTGGIGSGKSAVASRLGQLGAVIIDSDVLAREVVAPGTPGLSDIVAEFGAGIVGSDGGLDRPALARRVFNDDAARKSLEGIIHPLVRERSWQLREQAPPDAIVVNDVPLLVEGGMAPSFDLVIVVTAALDLRIDRLKARGLDAQQAQARIAAQATDTQREAAADAVIDNSGTLDALTDVVQRLHSERLIVFERNKRDRVVVCDAPHPVGASPGRLARARARIAHVLGVGTETVSADIVDGGAARVRVPVADHRLDVARDSLERAGFFDSSSRDQRVFCGTDPYNPCQVLLG